MTEREELAAAIRAGRAVMGIELGSTRIKAVLIGEDHAPAAMGAFDWENRLEGGVWTYHMADVWAGIQGAYAALKADVAAKFGVELRSLRGIGISAMMHGYLPFDGAGKQLAPFRTWRNTTTGEAAEALTALLGVNIPQRWSVAHLYQAVLGGEAHVPQIAFLTTLAGYVHWQLTGERVLGVGDASGMFPIDSVTGDYDAAMVARTDAALAAHGCGLKLREILPRVLQAGAEAGRLTEAGAQLLDPAGTLAAGIPLCPPEGDAGTGMVATDSVRVRTGNVSAGTSVFAMVVLEKPLRAVHPEIDLVTTPSGRAVAMVHCNNCTSDINAWVELLLGFGRACGKEISRGDAFTALFHAAMAGEKDCGGVVNCNYLSGEPVTGLSVGRPMVARLPDGTMSFANFARAMVFGAVATLKLGMDILAKEQVKIDALLGHGGFFKTPGTAQQLLAGALNTPVTTMETAGEGGPWGMALLAAYAVERAPGETLEDYLAHKVFAGAERLTLAPDAADAAGFAAYMARFQGALGAERALAAELS